MQRYCEIVKIDCDGDHFKTGMQKDQQGKWVLYWEVAKEIKVLEEEIKVLKEDIQKRKDKDSFDNAWDGY